jgi:predicted GH43/DUF377 family glycosyl hydrolase
MTFGVEAMLLDLKNPAKIIRKTKGAMFTPSESYEKFGKVADIVFPTGALIRGEKLEIYYGGADTVCCVASVNFKNLLAGLDESSAENLVKRYEKNPILLPKNENGWENFAVFNPGAFQDGSNINIIYRAMSSDFTSTFGLAISKNGLDIETRLNTPIYIPRVSFENKIHPGNSGCEDPRFTVIADKVYVCYTAYNGVDVPRVALSYISLPDFRKRNWEKWSEPVLLSPAGIDDKDACIFPEKINGKFLLLHRLSNDICADYVESLESIKETVSLGTSIILPRKGMWDGEKVGITAPPIKTKKGWLLLYHGVSSTRHIYRVGAVLLDLKNPFHVIARTDQPIFEPKEKYEMEGVVPRVVFPCGLAKKGDRLFIYYGGADTVVGVATASIKKILNIFA